MGDTELTEDELLQIKHCKNAVINAPAGHGKTEMVAELVSFLSGKQLILTHTNAGVEAIKKRMIKKNVQSSGYTILTIAAFCSMWGAAYHWTAKIDARLSSIDKTERQKYYAQLYTGCIALFSHTWAGYILKKIYKGIIVDEYQDCTVSQHSLIKVLNCYLPVRVFGDPLQGIFGFKEPIVKWNKIPFKHINITTFPWRWKNSNPKLGNYLTKLRNLLLPAVDGKHCTIDLEPKKDVLEIIYPQRNLKWQLLTKIKQYESVAYLTKWEHEQLKFCKNMGGIFQNDEKKECDILLEYAKRIDDEDKIKCALAFLEFVSECATNVRTKFKSYFKHLTSNSFNFSKIKNYKELGLLLSVATGNSSYQGFVDLLKWFAEKKEFQIYRKILYKKMLCSMQYAIDNGINLFDAAKYIYSYSSLQNRYTSFKYLSSRPLLSKGLEFDCVIIDSACKFNAMEFYVAMTRARKMVFIISDEPHVNTGQIRITFEASDISMG